MGCNLVSIIPGWSFPELSVPWQSIQTIGTSWGINKYTNVYKSGDDLLALYKTVENAGGSFLLNLGPDEHGELDPNEVESLVRFGTLLQTA
jgi:alpha-L-fucosidase